MSSKDIIAFRQSLEIVHSNGVNTGQVFEDFLRPRLANCADFAAVLGRFSAHVVSVYDGEHLVDDCQATADQFGELDGCYCRWTNEIGIDSVAFRFSDGGRTLRLSGWQNLGGHKAKPKDRAGIMGGDIDKYRMQPSDANNHYSMAGTIVLAERGFEKLKGGIAKAFPSINVTVDRLVVTTTKDDITSALKTLCGIHAANVGFNIVFRSEQEWICPCLEPELQTMMSWFLRKVKRAHQLICLLACILRYLCKFST
eukprot:Opistho-2@75316